MEQKSGRCFCLLSKLCPHNGACLKYNVATGVFQQSFWICKLHLVVCFIWCHMTIWATLIKKLFSNYMYMYMLVTYKCSTWHYFCLQWKSDALIGYCASNSKPGYNCCAYFFFSVTGLGKYIFKMAEDNLWPCELC